MNILFHTYCKVHPTKGGTERTTITLASSLVKKYGANVFSIYELHEEFPKEDCFVKEFYWTPQYDYSTDVRFLRGIMKDYQINCVIIQGSFIHVPKFQGASANLNCSVLFAHHFEPKFELTFESFKHKLIFKQKSVLDLVKIIKRAIFYPFVSLRKHQRLAALYESAYNSADRVILLNDRLISPFAEFAGINDTNKIKVIPNALTFDFPPYFDDCLKKNEILIVSRLDESSKRLTLAFRIWAEIKKDELAKEWVLRVIGHGKDLKRYKKLIHTEQIPDVSFEGRQNPLPYYKTGSIFFMTSKSESWGLTLTEAQQTGVVPIAFDTFPSLHEIIKDGVNGFIITEGDFHSYTQRAKDLMRDSDLRHRLARGAVSSANRFSQERIAGMWWKVILENQNLGG